MVRHSLFSVTRKIACFDTCIGHFVESPSLLQHAVVSDTGAIEVLLLESDKKKSRWYCNCVESIAIEADGLSVVTHRKILVGRT